MKTIGLIHGMSSVSTADFYRQLNAGVQQRLGGHESAELLMASVNFAVIDRCVAAQDWEQMGRYLASKAESLARAGADFLVIGSNTGHQVAAAVEQATPLPLLQVGDVVADAAAEAGVSRLGLLGTLPVMEGGYYQARLGRRGIDVLVPEAADRETTHRMVFEELTRGVFTAAARAELTRIMRDLEAAGAQAVVLGCTEFPLLVGEDDVPGLLLFDTAQLHVEATVRMALADDAPAPRS